MRRAVVLLAAANALAMAAGFAREMSLAYYFGATAAADAFVVVLLLVDGVATVALTGLAGSALVPQMTRLIETSRPGEEFRLMESLGLWCAAAGLAAAAPGLIWPGGLAGLLAPEFGPQQRELLAHLLRLALPAVPLALTAGLTAGALQARARYSTPPLGRAAFSLSVAGAAALGGRCGNVAAAGAGLLAGTLAQWVWQAAALWRSGWRPRRPRWRHPAAPEALGFALPVVLALALSNVVMGAAQRALASGLAAGSLAAVNYAQRALGLTANLTLALGTVSLRELSRGFERAGLGDGTLRTLARAMDAGVLLLAPGAVWMALASEPLVALLFERGRFDSASSALTAACLRWFALSLPPGALLAVLVRAYAAFWRPWAAFWVSAVWTAATVLASWALLGGLQARALPAGYALGTAVAVAAAVAGLWRQAGAAFFAARGRQFARTVLWAGLAGVAAALLAGPRGAGLDRLLAVSALFWGGFAPLSLSRPEVRRLLLGERAAGAGRARCAPGPAGRP
jgi:putative peptidoglycan lipid II flippase